MKFSLLKYNKFYITHIIYSFHVDTFIKVLLISSFYQRENKNTRKNQSIVALYEHKPN